MIQELLNSLTLLERVIQNEIIKSLHDNFFARNT